MLRTRLIWLAFLLTALTPAQAEDTPPITILLGAGVWSRPAYNGADTNQPTLIPVVRYYGEPWFVRTTFGMLEGGARTTVLDGLTLGAQLAYEGGRASAESDFLRNMPTLAPSLSWGAHIELEKKLGPMPIIALLRYRQEIEDSRGEQTDLRLTAGVFSNAGLNAGVFAQSTWATKKSANYYYGISTQQASSSGFAAFEAAGGQLFSAYGLLWSYDLNRQWVLLGSVELRQVRDAVIDSPLIQQNANRYASVGVAYQF